MTAERVRGGSDTRAVTDDIRAAILHAEFAPGQRLVESDLCEQFDASRGSVRAALVSLAADGLIERIANRGARVRVVPLDEAIEIYEVRMVIEALCAAKAAERADDGAVDELRRIGTDMQAAVAAGDVFGYSSLNQRLHQLLRELSGQRTAADVLDRLRGQLVRHQFRLATQPGRPQVSLGEHLAIIDAVCTHDPERAARAVEVHLASVMQAMKDAPVRGSSPV